MAAATTTTRTRDTDNLNLRMPSGLRDRVIHAAGNVSQNAFINSSLLFSTLVCGPLPAIGHPKNIIALAEEIDRAIRANNAVIGAFDKSDWSDVEPFLKLLEMVDLVSNIEVRTDAKAQETIVFRFELTRNGVGCWDLVRRGLRAAVDRLEEESKKR